MNIIVLPIEKLIVSDKNVRKTLTSEEDETSIVDLANDIKTNGLINPLTVRKLENGNYEVVAGQRRLLALRQLACKESSCHVIDVSDTKAEEISLVENVQRNQMTTGDKVKAYNKLYEIYEKNIDKVAKSINVSKNTIKNYIKISSLPDCILEKLDSKGHEKISLDVAIEFVKLPENLNKKELLENIINLTNDQKVRAIKMFSKLNTTDVNKIIDIKDNIVIEDNNIHSVTGEELMNIIENVHYPPYIIDSNNRKLIIPKNLYQTISEMIKNLGIIQYIEY